MLEDKTPQKTDLEQLGEFGLIETLTHGIKLHHESSLKGIGDDAAVLNFKDKKVVITTDMLVEGVHFDLGYMPLKHVGYKAVMVNLSDVCAMNATPTQITVSLAVSNRFPLEALEELYSGIRLAADLYKVDVVGGDTTSTTKGMVISITALGIAEEEKLTYRSGANATDLLVVSGDLGGAYMGLKVMQRENEVFKVNPKNQPDLEPYQYLVERLLKPEARVDIVKLLSELEVVPTSMIDISDGLSSEILHLCNKSKVGCDLYEDKLPIDPTVISICEEFDLNSTTIALSGGDEYELLFTVAQKDYDKIKANPNLTVIGYMTEEAQGANLVTRADQKIPLKAMGWNSFQQD